MWCDACRAVGAMHCANPDECGNMLSDQAASDNWNAWLDDLPISAEFQPAIERLQDFISGLASPAPAWSPPPEADRPDGYSCLIWVHGGWCKGTWWKAVSQWRADGDFYEPGHFHPLPAPPANSKGDGR